MGPGELPEGCNVGCERSGDADDLGFRPEHKTDGVAISRDWEGPSWSLGTVSWEAHGALKGKCAGGCLGQDGVC